MKRILLGLFHLIEGYNYFYGASHSLTTSKVWVLFLCKMFFNDLINI